MNVSITRLAAAVALIVFSLPLSAQTAREQLERFSAGLETLHAEFEQSVTSSDGEVQDRSAGEVWLSRPDRFRWAYGGDYPELVISDGARIWVYDEMLEQVTVKDPSQVALDSPLALLTDPGRLEEQFEVREVGSTDRVALLELRARRMETEFERFLVGMAEDSVELIIMEDSFGLRTEIRFGSVQRNPAIDAGLFEFTPPEGTDVIGVLPGPGEAR